MKKVGLICILILSCLFFVTAGLLMGCSDPNSEAVIEDETLKQAAIDYANDLIAQHMADEAIDSYKIEDTQCTLSADGSYLVVFSMVQADGTAMTYGYDIAVSADGTCTLKAEGETIGQA